MPTDVAYDRPITAELYVHLANGEKFKATEADLAKFGLVNKLDAYIAITSRLTEALGDKLDGRLTSSQLNPVRYLIECALMYPAHFTEFPDDMAALFAQIADIEQRLLDNPATDDEDAERPADQTAAAGAS